MSIRKRDAGRAGSLFAPGAAPIAVGRQHLVAGFLDLLLGLVAERVGLVLEIDELTSPLVGFGVLLGLGARDPSMRSTSLK